MALTQEKRIEHHRGYGASTAATILLGRGFYRADLGRRITRYDLWSMKIGELPEEQESMRFDAGHAMEPVIAKWLAREDHIVSVELAQDETIRHPLMPWLLCHLDAWVTDTDGNRVPGEFKTAEPWHAGKWGPSGSDEIPEDYLIQVQQQLAVTGEPYAYVAPAIGFGEMRWYRIEASEAIQDAIIRETERFRWHVDNRVPPEPEAATDYKQLFRQSAKKAREVDRSTVAKIARREAIRARMKAMEAEVEAIDLELWPVLEDHEELTHDGLTVLKAKTTKAGARPWTVNAGNLTKIRRNGK